MGEGGGGRGEGGEELSPFLASIFPLFPQKRLILRIRIPVHVYLYNAINLPGTGNIFFFSAQIGKRTVVGVFEAWDRGGGGGGGGGE